MEMTKIVEIKLTKDEKELIKNTMTILFNIMARNDKLNVGKNANEAYEFLGKLLREGQFD